MNAAGARAILKIGLGGTTLTAAKNIKQLGLDMLMLTSLEDIAVFRPVAEVLGDKFFFVASPAQVYEALPDGALKAEIGRFLTALARQVQRSRSELGRARLGCRDADRRGGREGEDRSTGAKLRDTLETMDNFQGTTGVYHFSPTNHQGITENPLLLARIVNGKVEVAK